MKSIDPIRLFRERLLADGIDAGELDAIVSRAASEAEAAIEYARQSDFPDLKEMYTHVFG
jgi:TPP-dependent pyruvate/acetoin dehydrogenase alpha subunit